MSYIAFHSESETVNLWGTERFYAMALVNSVALAALGPSHFKENAIRQLMVSSYQIRPEFFAKDFETWLSVGQGSFLVDGRNESVWDCSLNTAMAIGDDPLRLLARLHGQCEIHCWVEGANRDWLASIIQSGLDKGVYRKLVGGHSVGWPRVIDLLRSRTDEPVTCSYSVMDGFPNATVAGFAEGETDEEAEASAERFYSFSKSEQWTLAMTNLRTDRPYLELKPEGWADYRFGDGLSMFDIRKVTDDTRIDMATA